VDQLELLIDTMQSNNVCRDLINGINVEYEQPGIGEIEGMMWKGKADIYNYDSQAYIYRKLFGYDLVFIAIDKKTKQIGIFDCSDAFYENGKDKVQQAVEQYKLFYENPDFNPNNYFINKTL
jgi:hypothetical protein